ncbi:MAG TPA: hypothetical protein DCM71_12760 [Runella sp.]|nr:hypothetical protein [Runella sp.]
MLFVFWIEQAFGAYETRRQFVEGNFGGCFRRFFAMIVLTVLVALQKGKVTEEELLQQKVELLKRLVSKGFSRGKIEALMGFLKLYVRFGKRENDVKFDEAIELLLNKPKETMGIVEFVLERERRLGEKRGLVKGEKKGIEKGIGKGIEKGIEKGVEKGIEQGIETQKLHFANTLLSETDFDDVKIASLADVTVETVQKLRKEKEDVA